MRKKSLLALVLAFVMLLSGCALFEKNPEKDRATEIIHVGEKIYTKGEIQDEVDYQLSYMSYVYSLYGMEFDPADPDTLAAVQQQVIDYLIEEAVIEKKIGELGLSNLTEEEQTALNTVVDASWQENLESVKASYFAETELTGEELDKALIAKSEELGFTRDLIEESEKSAYLQTKLYNHVISGVTVSEEDIQAAYDAAVAADKDTYTQMPEAYGSRVNNASAVSYYRPAGYRMVKQILVSFTEEDQALMAQVEELIAQQQAAVTEATAALGDTANVNELLSKVTVTMAQPAITVSFGAETTSLTDPVSTEAPALEIAAEFDETVDEATATAVKALAEAKALLEFYTHQLTTATNNAFANIDAQADDILAQLKAGADWDALMAEKTADPGMQAGAATAETGYAVSAASTATMDEAFVNAAMALGKVGDISPKTRGIYGYYIIQYTAEVAEGPVALEDVRAELEAQQLYAKQQTAYEEALGLWVAEAGAKVNYDKLK